VLPLVAALERDFGEMAHPTLLGEIDYPSDLEEDSSIFALGISQKPLPRQRQRGS
jgi:hypothetical protein